MIYLKSENIRYLILNDSTCYFSVHKSTSRSSRPQVIYCAGTQSTIATAGSTKQRQIEPVREPTPPWLRRSSRFARPPPRRPPPRRAASESVLVAYTAGSRSPSNRQSGTRSRCQPLSVRPCQAPVGGVEVGCSRLHM